MKCAMELMATATARKIEIENEKIAERERYLAKVRKNTIAWCEKIGCQLEEMANQGKSPIFSFVFSEINGDGYEMVSNTTLYADHRESWHSTGEKLSLAIIAEWFSQYCFSVYKQKIKVWRYGLGQLNALGVTIKPTPDCME